MVFESSMLEDELYPGAKETVERIYKKYVLRRVLLSAEDEERVIFSSEKLNLRYLELKPNPGNSVEILITKSFKS